MPRSSSGTRSGRVRAVMAGLIGIGTALSLSVLAPATAANASTLPPPAPTTKYTVIDIHHYENIDNPGMYLASCRSNGCSLSITTATSTTISTSLGISKDGVAAGIGFSKSKTVSTTATCPEDGKMKSGDIWVGYRVGKQAMYKVKKEYRNGDIYTVTTSGWLFSWQPYTGANIECHMIKG